MPTRGYVAGKPVSRWEADSDNIDIEYKNLDRPRPPGWCAECFSGPKGMLLRILLVFVIFFVGLIIGYVIRRNVHENFIKPKLKTGIGVQQDYDKAVSKELRDRVTHVDNYNDSIDILTMEIRLAGMGKTSGLIHYVLGMWTLYHFNSIKVKKYRVQLSYPDYVNTVLPRIQANRVLVNDGSDKVLFESHTNLTNVHPEYLPFNAYSHDGNVEGDLVYAHYGRREDFEVLEDEGIDVNNTIVLIRYGKIHAGNKVKHAEDRGAIGVILYSDPHDFTDGRTHVDSSSWWLPSWAVMLAQVRSMLVGDPRTPEYPAVAGIQSMSDSESVYPTIPVHPISYSDAEQLLRYLDGDEVRKDWQGGLNVTYRTGPGFQVASPWINSTVNLNVKNVKDIREATNVIATINGIYEEDQFVIVGAHIDSWTMGAIDAGTGFAVLMEIARTFSDQVNKGWRPRRTIIFAIWDASKFGHVGAYEWVQEYEKQLGFSAVAYINLDAAVRGKYSFYAEASPQLYDVIYQAAMTVNCCHPENTDQSVYDVWQQRMQNKDFGSKPWINDPCGDSDQAPFLYRLGVPVMSPAFTYDMFKYPNLPTYPAYSTLDDNAAYLKTFVDGDFSLHITLTQVVADVILRLADSALLPLSVKNYEKTLDKGLKVLQSGSYADDFKNAGISISNINATIQNFTAAAATFQKNYIAIDKKNISEFVLHHKNVQLVQLPRAFIFDRGLPKQPQYRNVLLSPHPENLNEEIVFPGVMTAITQGRKTGSWDLLREQVGVLQAALLRAKDILTEDMISTV